MFPHPAPIVQGPGEGELLGDVLQNGQRTTDSTLYVVLAALNSETEARLTEWSPSMWVSPTNHNGRTYMFEWIDPRADGACGSLEDYLAGNLAARSSEMHWIGPTTPPLAGVEKHCIRPGSYSLALSHSPSGSNPIKVVQFDYVPLRGAPGSMLPVNDASSDVVSGTEELDYDATSYMWSDIFVMFELNSVPGSDSPVLAIENQGASPYWSQFNGSQSASGGKYDYFRFSSRASTTTTSGFGRLLSRLYWDRQNLTNRTGFFDAHSQTTGLIRTHQFLDATQSRVYDVGLETMRPSEQPQSAPDHTWPVGITVPAQPPPALLNSISGPDLLEPVTAESAAWVQAATAGMPAYSYGGWFYYRSPGPEVPVGSGGGYSRVVQPTSSPYVFKLRAVASDQAPQSATAKYFVEVVPSGGGGGAPSAPMIPDRRTVRLQDGSCGPRPPSGPARQQWLAWVFEQRSGRVELCRAR